MLRARSRRAGILAVASLLTLSQSAYAQTDRGTITGQVTDQSGAIITGASVKAVHVATNFERTVTTSKEGSYTIPQLPVGGYVVIVTAANFQTTTLENIEVTAGGTVRVDAQLAIGGVKDAVTVTSDARQIQTDDVKVTTAISSKFIQDLPLVVGGQLRSPLDLSLIAPEAKAGTSGDDARGNIVIGGGQEGGWDLSVDGVSATPAAPFEQRLWTTLNSPSVEAITEFAVDSNGFKAEFGNAEVRNPNERGPWFLNENIAIARTFARQKTHLDLRFEAFNLLNRTIWGTPDSTITSANLGKVTTLANSPRQMQLGVRFEF